MAGEPSLRYILRISKVLEQYPAIGISNLAMLARVNHKRCALAVRWLEDHGYVSVSDDSARRIIKLTEKGMTYVALVVSIAVPEQLPAVM